ncbi:MAG: hypothetical protein ACK5P7_08560 [Bdellovibrio sp.]|jgi:hypothetical protein
MKSLMTALVSLFFLAPTAQAFDDAFAPRGFKWSAPELQKPQLVAQADGDDAYDPFSDYSEFDEASDEEADINFFRNGRFFVLGFTGGMRAFTDNLDKLYGSGPSYGFFMSFFFDLRFALQAGFVTGDYAYELGTANGKTTGNVSMTFLDVSLKYYLNTQNVTRGLADLNPYMMGGISQTYRTLTISGTGDSARDATMGMHIGGGLEIPLMRKKAFFGIQGLYRYFNFKDENQALIDPVTQLPTTVKPTGDSYDVMGSIGLNF